MAEPREMRCRVPLRVRFGETDAVGVANNAVYLSWFEVGRIEYMRATGHDYARVHAGGIDLVVAEATVRYVRPLRFDDEIDLHCWCSRLQRASVEFSYELWSRAELCATGTTLHACVERARMAPVRLPEWLVALVAG